MTPQLPSISFLFEDEHIFALSKRPNCHSVKGEGESVADLLESSFPSLKNASPNRSDAGLVSRLDFETSGVILGAKNRVAWEKMRDLFRLRLIEKSYIAILEGKVPKNFEAKGHIGSKGRSAQRVRVFESCPSKKFRALPAITHFSLISYSERLSVSLVEAKSKYGRRHQVRAHAASKGSPLLGDILYGSKGALPRELGRSFFLHASRVSFYHPFRKERIEILDELPSVIKDLF